MELKNKKIAFLGDSITFGSGTSSEDMRYTSVFEKISGAAVDNFGVCATRIARRLVPHPTPSWNDTFVDRAKRMTDDYDVICVFGGTNDYANPNPTPLGVIDDTDEHTFYGALKILCETLLTMHPHAIIAFATPIHRRADYNYGLPGLCLKDYVTAIKEIAETYSIPVLDLYATAGIQSKIPAVMEEYLADGLHPNDRGHERIAQKFYSFLKTL